MMDPTTLSATAAFIERYAARLANGPAVKEYGYPINRNRYEGDEIAFVVPLLNALASSIRAGLDPEHDWPRVGLPEGNVRLGEVA